MKFTVKALIHCASPSREAIVVTIEDGKGNAFNTAFDYPLNPDAETIANYFDILLTELMFKIKNHG